MSRGNPSWVNDVHSQLNPTRVREVLVPNNIEELTAIVRRAVWERTPISIAGCRHAMGGQQFATDSVCIDTRRCARLISIDRERGLIEAEAGIQWPELIEGYLVRQEGMTRPWGIAQKQTGANTFTLGGSLSANAHGRGLTMKPLIADVESFTLLNAEGRMLRCSREENPQLFRLAIGGYGLFGLIVRVTLRLVPRRKLRRTVELVSATDLAERFEARIAAGFSYGDFQFSVDERASDFLQRGVFSCYEPIPEDSPMVAPQRLSDEDWLDLLALAYADRGQAFEKFARYYLGTDGQTYWSDTHQLGAYLPDYAQRLRARLGGPETSLVITELYVPRAQLAGFLAAAADLLRESSSPVVYGTVRLIEKDDESFLPWAREASACVIFNLQTRHSPAGIAAAADTFRALIDLAIARTGSYFLTYHRFATRAQVAACYPNFGEFLEAKEQLDPGAIFASDWHRHYAQVFRAG